MWRLLVLVALVWANHHELPESSVAKDPNTRLILWGTRHGNRNPGQFVKQDPQTWGFEGANELTRFGKRQALGLGRELRKFVGDWVSENYLPEEVKYYSSSASRCQMTLQGAVAGFHRPREWGLWKYELNRWSPTPYTIDDPLLRMYAVEKCPGSDDAWRPISEDTLPELQEITHEKKTILDYIAKNTGWNASIADAADLADNLIVIKLSKAPYPDWIEHPTLPGYSKERLLYHIGKFAENHQIKCAEYGPCRHMMGGYWLKNILDALKKAAKDEGPKVIGYASHTEVTLALMKLLHIEKEELTTSAGFVVEFRLKPAPSVRLLNHDPHKTDLHVIYQAEYSDDLKKVADAAGWIPLDDFVKAVEGEVIDDWQAECRVPPKKCDA